MSYNKKHIMTRAWEYFRGTGLTFPEALSLSWGVAKSEEVQAIINERPVEFVFRKKNGEARRAKGVRNLSYIPEAHHPRGTGTTSADVVTYYDLDKGAYRSFRNGAVISINK